METQEPPETQTEASSSLESKTATYICEFCSAPFTRKEDFLLHFTESACKIQSIGRIESKDPNQVESEIQNSSSDLSSSVQDQQVTVSAPQILCTVDMILCEQGNKIFIAPDTFRVAEQSGNLQQILSLCQVQTSSDDAKASVAAMDNGNQIVITEGNATNVLTPTGAVVTVTDNLSLGEQHGEQEIRTVDKNQINEEGMDIQLVIHHVEKNGDGSDEVCKDSILSSLTSSEDANPNDQSTYQCEVCHKHFKKPSGLERHKVVHTRDITKKFLCDICGRVFTTLNRLLKHEEIHEKAREEEHRRKHELQELEGTTEENSEAFICETCQKTFTQSCCLLEHERIHFKDNIKKHRDKYPCSMCDKWFHAASHLARHEKSHDRKNTFTCDTCGESFPRQNTLQKHQAIHSNVKPFVCNICGRGFMQSSNLTTHLRTHSKAKPYVCRTCDKSFSHSSSRVIHERIHTGEKPYLCENCGKKFRQSGDLAKHQRSHTGEKPYQCAVCAKTFSVQSNLLAHLRIHVKKNSQNPLSVAMLVTEETSQEGEPEPAAEQQPIISKDELA